MGRGITDDFRKDAVRIALTSGLTRKQVADDLGVGMSTLNKWITAYRDGTLSEKIVIPQILVLLLGYLPLPTARLFRSAGFAAGCGRLMMVRADAYARAGGHAAFRHLMHDGLNLPRNVRRSGGRTDIVDATSLARCRMYDNWADIRSGFTNNATEGMAKPVALPVWTLLLAAGHVLPFLLLPLVWALGASTVTSLFLAAIGIALRADTSYPPHTATAAFSGPSPCRRGGHAGNSLVRPDRRATGEVATVISNE